jgi:hypothetical protein
LSPQGASPFRIFNPLREPFCPVLYGVGGAWGCCARGVFLLYIVDDSDLQVLKTWMWDRLSSWSDLFALAVMSYQEPASTD